jgi:hypothetical protein
MSQVHRKAIARVMTKVCLGDSYLSSFPIDVPSAVPEKEGIEDHTETNLVNLLYDRRKR